MTVASLASNLSDKKQGQGDLRPQKKHKLSHSCNITFRLCHVKKTSMSIN